MVHHFLYHSLTKCLSGNEEEPQLPGPAVGGVEKKRRKEERELHYERCVGRMRQNQENPGSRRNFLYKATQNSMHVTEISLSANSPWAPIINRGEVCTSDGAWDAFYLLLNPLNCTTKY